MTAPMEKDEALVWCPCKNHARFTESCALCKCANGQRWIDHRMAVDGFNESMVRGAEVRQLRERAERAEATIASLEAGIGHTAEQFDWLASFYPPIKAWAEANAKHARGLLRGEGD